MTVAAIAAKEHRHDATTDISRAYLNAPMDGALIYMNLSAD
eukprot:gene7196-9215_t